MSKGEETRIKIMTTARELFNHQGPDNVSTVQICKALPMSPGNLYYYYRNKEEIIRGIFEMMVADYRENWDPQEMEKPEFDTVQRIIVNLRIFHKYRFLMNHMTALANNDPQLHERYKQTTAQRRQELVHYFQIMERNGFMDFGNDTQAIDKLVSVLWFLGDFWLMNQELRHPGGVPQLTAEMEQEYLDVNLFLTVQFLTEKGRHSFAQKMKK